MTYRWQCAHETHTGHRRKTNEDAVLARPDLGLWAVADGMGGHEAGDVASQCIAEALDSVDEQPTLAALVDEVEDQLNAVNRRLRDHAQSHCRGRTVGSTVVTMLAEGDVGVALWAGDSRLYRLRNGELTQITRDHNPIADLLDDGVITERTALAKDTNVITRAVGGQPVLHLDVAVFDVEPWDTFLLCTDGLYREVGEEEMANVLAGSPVEDSVEELLARCLARGARDNVSIVVSRTEC
jgi:protein phosphatase